MRAMLERWRVSLFWLLGYEATANRKERRGRWFMGGTR